jgi:hypothetical protein
MNADAPEVETIKAEVFKAIDEKKTRIPHSLALFLLLERDRALGKASPEPPTVELIESYLRWVWSHHNIVVLP